jgi:hypothetical protein
MKLYDVEARAQQGLSQSGQDDEDDYKPANRKLNRDFSSIKV